MIELKDVSFTYSNSKENNLSNLSLTIKKGEVVVVCGESGCGKTTVTRLINGLIPHYYEGEISGEVLIEGQNILEKNLYDIAYDVSSVFQNPKTQFFNVDTTSEIVFGCENRGMGKDVIQNKFETVVSDLGIESLVDRNIFNLSGGEKQKIACAGAAITEPKILVLDEPTSNLDTFSINDLSKLIEKWKSQGKTIIIAEHRLYFLRKYADIIIYMQNGKIKGDFSRSDMEDLSDVEFEMMGLRPFNVERLYQRIGANPLQKANTQSLSKAEYQVFSDMEFSYKHKKKALCIPSLKVKENSITAIIGHNGAGKTTFARCLCGLERKCKGNVFLDSEKCPCKKNVKNCKGT